MSKIDEIETRINAGDDFTIEPDGTVRDLTAAEVAERKADEKMHEERTEVDGIVDYYVQIEARVRRVATTYRYYGVGRWAIKIRGKWEPTNGIYVPGVVLKVAALYCENTPPASTDAA